VKKILGVVAVLALDGWNGTLPQCITESSPVPVIDLFR